MSSHPLHHWEYFSVKKEHQGIAASLVATVVNCSISLALGFAGTVEMNIADGNALKGYRGGLSGLGILISLVFLLKSYWQGRQGSAVTGIDGK